MENKITVQDIAERFDEERLRNFTAFLVNNLLENDVAIMREIKTNIEHDPLDGSITFRPRVEISYNLDFSLHDKKAINRYIKRKFFVK